MDTELSRTTLATKLLYCLAAYDNASSKVIFVAAAVDFYEVLHEIRQIVGHVSVPDYVKREQSVRKTHELVTHLGKLIMNNDASARQILEAIYLLRNKIDMDCDSLYGMIPAESLNFE